MPYIKKTERELLDPIIEQLYQTLSNMELDMPDTDTEDNITYCFMKLLLSVYGSAETTSPSSTNDVLGILSMTSTEYTRKVISNYQSQREYENGSINSISCSGGVVGVIDVTPEQEDF